MNEPIQEWMSKQMVGDEMLWKGAWGRQLSFVRDDLTAVLATSLRYEDTKKITTVISTHRSKSIILPVYCMTREDLGLKLILRNNFYNWKLSVISEFPIEAPFEGLFYTTPPIEPEYTGNPLSPVYFEGFPSDLIFGYYTPSDGRKWSAEIWDNHSLWTTLFILMKSRGAIKPFVWHTKESHRKALEEEYGKK